MKSGKSLVPDIIDNSSTESCHPCSWRHRHRLSITKCQHSLLKPPAMSLFFFLLLSFFLSSSSIQKLSTGLVMSFRSGSSESNTHRHSRLQNAQPYGPLNCIGKRLKINVAISIITSASMCVCFYVQTVVKVVEFFRTPFKKKSLAILLVPSVS